MFQLSPNWPLLSGSEGKTHVAKTLFFIQNLHGLLRCEQHKLPVTLKHYYLMEDVILNMILTKMESLNYLTKSHHHFQIHVFLVAFYF